MTKNQSQSLDGLFRPRSIAVVGASRRPQTIGHEVVRNLVSCGFQGPVYPVNPKAEVVRSIKAWPSLASIPDPVDLVVIVVPAPYVLQVVKDCAKIGVRGIVIVSAGFREVGEAGRQREDEVLSVAAKHGMRVIGPNCMGILNTEPAVAMNASFAAETPTEGKIGFVSQSGALGEAILAHARSTGLGLRMFASVGNRADVGAHDLLAYWENDPGVEVILLYLESLGDPTRFREVAERLRGKKPIIAVKSGRSLRGASAAGSHTGSVAGADRVVDVFLRQCGVLRADSLREMFSFAGVLLHQPRPRGNRVAIVTNAGGPGILATDALAGLGLAFSEFSAKTTRALRKALPPEASVTNPVDLIASADAKRYQLALRAVVADDAVDALVVMFVSPIMIDAAAVAAAIVAETEGKSKPVVACIMGRVGGDQAIRILKEAGIPSFRFPEEAAQTLSGLIRYRDLSVRSRGKKKVFEVDQKLAGRLVRRQLKAGGGWLAAADVKSVLSAYGIPMVASQRAKSLVAAQRAALALGFPVVLKAESKTLLHKSDAGGVVVGLKNEAEFAAALEAMGQKLRPKHPDLSFEVQTMITGERELLLGLTRDPDFGPQIVVGFGGVEVEIWRNVCMRAAPLHSDEPERMLQSLQGAALLDGYRGEPAIDKKLVTECLLRLSQLAEDCPDILELDINPFIVGAQGRRSAAVDARILIRSP